MGELKKSADEWKAIIKGSFELELEPYRNVLGGWLKNLPKFENMGDAMRHAISASEYQYRRVWWRSHFMEAQLILCQEGL